jgi:hypothetical protein
LTNRQIERWLAQEIHGRQIPRKPPQRASVLKPKPWRSLRYRQWIKSLPSAVSGLTPCDPCHTGPHAFGQKASDLTCIPLTRSEHEEFGKNPHAFCQKHQLDVTRP